MGGRETASSPEAIELRADISTPYGVFRSAEMGQAVLAVDAVAEAVMRAGCTGLEFQEPETSYGNFGSLRLRGPFGIEFDPNGVEDRRQNGQPVPEF